MKSETISLRIDEFTKKASEEVLKELGLSLSMAINMFLKQVVYSRKIPFKVSVPAYIIDNDLSIDDLNILYKKKLECDNNNLEFNLENEIKLLNKESK